MQKQPNLHDLLASFRDDQVDEMRQWLADGLDPNTMVANLPLVHHAVRKGAEQKMHLLLKMGADPNKLSADYQQTAAHYAIDNCRPDLLHVLMSYGADAQHYTDRNGSLLHSAVPPMGNAERGMEIVDSLLAAGANLHRPDRDGKIPLQLTRTAPYEFSCHLRNRYNLDEAIRSKSLNREELAKPRAWPGLDAAYHQAWVDMPPCWAWMDKIAPLLEKVGESITRAEVTEKPERLAWAVVGGSLPALNAHLEKQGERKIGLEDFVRKGQATPALKEICRMSGERKLLELDWVQKELSPNELVSLYKALPPESRERVPNYHQTLQLLRQESVQENGRGR